MCGKVLPYRDAPLILNRLVRGAASNQSETKKRELAGKAEPFRTSGGEAAT